MGEKMRSLILILTCLILVAPCKAVGKRPRFVGADQIEQRIKIQQERLKDIDEQVSKERQTTEKWYTRQLADLQRLAARRAKQLILSKRMFWAEFVEMNNQVTYTDSYFSNVVRTFVGGTKAFKLRAALMDSYFLGVVADLLMDNDFRKLLTGLADGSGYNPQGLLIRSEARKLLRLVEEFDSQRLRLQDRRSAKLDALAQREKDMRADVFRVVGEIKTQPKAPNLGIVNVISYEEKDAVCMVEGSDKILRAGDMIGNITVMEIRKNRVEFVKDSQRWIQAVGQPANSAWR
jgi:hypothetical protein